MKRFIWYSKLIVGMAFFLFGALGLSYAQDSIQVKQNGQNNSVTIGPGSGEGKSESTECDRIMGSKASVKNNIVIKGTAATNDTLAVARGKGINKIKKKTDNHRLDAMQYGYGNGILAVLPDSGKSSLNLHSRQYGPNNSILALLFRSSTVLNFAQYGTDNMITVTPCEHPKLPLNHDNNTVQINQAGDSNAVSVHQQ